MYLNFIYKQKILIQKLFFLCVLQSPDFHPDQCKEKAQIFQTQLVEQKLKLLHKCL